MRFHLSRRSALPPLCAMLLAAAAIPVLLRRAEPASVQTDPPPVQTDPPPVQTDPPPVEEPAASEADPPFAAANPDFVYEGPRMVALTYDDGPDPIYTDQILDILEAHGAKATFFEIGKKLSGAPEALLREEALGCEIGSHSYGHQKFPKITSEEAAADLEASGRAFAAALGHPVTLFRPPYGEWSEALEDAGYVFVTWSADPADWQYRNAEEVVRFLQGLELDGQVVLLHSVYESSVEATRVLIPWLQEQGYELVTVSELLERRFGEAPEPNRLYNDPFFWSALPAQPEAGSYSNFKTS